MERLNSHEQPADQPRLNEAQEQSLREICERYGVPFSADHYIVYSPDSSMMAGWAEGWLGGPDYIGKTIYIGVSPEGERHS